MFIEQRQPQLAVGSASETELEQDFRPFAQRHVLDQQPPHPLAFAVGRSGIPPELREISRQRGNAGSLLFIEQQLIRLEPLLILLMRRAA